MPSQKTMSRNPSAKEFRWTTIFFNSGIIFVTVENKQKSAIATIDLAVFKLKPQIRTISVLPKSFWQLPLKSYSRRNIVLYSWQVSHLWRWTESFFDFSLKLWKFDIKLTEACKNNFRTKVIGDFLKAYHAPFWCCNTFPRLQHSSYSTCYTTFLFEISRPDVDQHCFSKATCLSRHSGVVSFRAFYP